MFLWESGSRRVWQQLSRTTGRLSWVLLGVVIGFIGKMIYKETGLWTFVALIVLPVLTFVFDRPAEIIVMSVCIGLILMAKRLTANWERPSADASLIAVLPRRLLWDRDVAGKTPWTGRSPSR